MAPVKVFVAYSSAPPVIGQTISAAIDELRTSSNHFAVDAWAELDIAGRFIIDGILEKIDASDFVVADISRVNFNVTFEVGYAVGRGKRIIPILNGSVQSSPREILQLGVFDTLGYTAYENAGELRKILIELHDSKPITFPTRNLDRSAPIYLLDTLHKTDTALRITSRLKKARISFRSFDPKEQPRLSALEAYRNVASSIAVVVNLLSSNSTDAQMNNLRGAFIAGLAYGMDRTCLIFQEGEEPVPLDYRDLVKVYRQPTDIDPHISELAPRVAEALQSNKGDKPLRQLALLERLDLGAPAAENEMGSLGSYYVETDEFNRTLAGTIRLAVGRKGSGKTALFIRVRDRVRNDTRNVVLDLKPDGHQLKRFKHMVLDLLAEAVKEHVAKAFWEYLLLLEIAYKLLEKDQERHVRDHTLYAPYQQLVAAYKKQYRRGEGDFSERMLELIERISAEFSDQYKDKTKYLTAEQVTNLVYKHDIPKMHEALTNYLELKGDVWILFDNIDKGWPTHGVGETDILILRSLLDATRHVEQSFARQQIKAQTVVFVRNDVFELLVDQSPDRGKESRASLDWTDPDLLKEFLRRRIVSNEGFPASDAFDPVWQRICVSHVLGIDSADYLIERSLMRPRNLLTLVIYSKGTAVNLSHDVITDGDIIKACENYSADIVNEIGLEIQDIFPDAPDSLYNFLGAKQWMNLTEVRKRLAESSIPEANLSRVIELLCWFSFLGVVRQKGAEIDETFIYDVRYDMKKFRRLAGDFNDDNAIFTIHRAFHPFLEVTS